MKAYLIDGFFGENSVELFFDDLSFVRLQPPELRIMSSDSTSELVVEASHLVTLLDRNMPTSGTELVVGRYHIFLNFPVFLNDFLTPVPVSSTSRATPVLDFEILRRLLEGGDTTCLDQLKGDRNAQY